MIMIVIIIIASLILHLEVPTTLTLTRLYLHPPGPRSDDSYKVLLCAEGVLRKIWCSSVGSMACTCHEQHP